LKLDFSDEAGVPRKDDTDRLHKAERLANLQIDAMYKVVQDPDKKEHKEILVNTFGEHYNIKAISRRVRALKTEMVKVAKARDDSLKPSTIALTRTSTEGNSKTRTSRVHFSAKYHDDQTDAERAGTLIHEASHALFGAKDYFKKDGKQKMSRAQADKTEKNDKISGYLIGKQYTKLRDDPNSAMHENADSWKAFGHHAFNGHPHPLLGRPHPDGAPDPNPRPSKRLKLSPAPSTSGSSIKQKHSQVPSKPGPSRQRGRSPVRSTSPKRKARISPSKPAPSKRKQSPSSVAKERSPPKRTNSGRSRSPPAQKK